MATLKRCLFCFVLSWAVLAASAAWAQQVTVDQDRRADFSHYRTYSWLKVSTPDSIWDHRVQDAVDGQLAANDFRLSKTRN